MVNIRVDPWGIAIPSVVKVVVVNDNNMGEHHGCTRGCSNRHDGNERGVVALAPSDMVGMKVA